MGKASIKPQSLKYFSSLFVIAVNYFIDKILKQKYNQIFSMRNPFCMLCSPTATKKNRQNNSVDTQTVLSSKTVLSRQKTIFKVKQKSKIVFIFWSGSRLKSRDTHHSEGSTYLILRLKYN